MTSVFDEKKGPKKPTKGELKQIHKMRKEGKSINEIEKLTGFDHNLLIDTFRKAGENLTETGAKKEELRVPNETVRQTYIDILNKAKKEIKNPQASHAELVKTIGKTELHKQVREKLQREGWIISDKTVRRKYATFDFEEEIAAETEPTEAEEATIAMEEQDEWTNITENVMWEPGEEHRNKTLNYIAYLYKIVSYRHGKWDHIDEKDVGDSKKLARIFIEAPNNKKPTCIQPKPIPFKDWTMNDVMWAMKYIDWVGRSGRFHYMTSFNRLYNDNPQLHYNLKDFSKQSGQPASKELWGKTTFYVEFKDIVAKHPEWIPRSQAPHTGVNKIVPEGGELGRMATEIKKMPMVSKTFSQVTDKQGKKLNLSKKIQEKLERDCVLLAIELACGTGMRAGHKRTIELGSLTFSGEATFDKTLNLIKCPTKMSKKQNKNIETHEYLIKKLEGWRDELESYNIDTTKMYIFPIRMQQINHYLRDAGIKAGVTHYVKVHGERVLMPGSREKYEIREFDASDPRNSDPKYEHDLIGFHNQKITEDPNNPDLHLHLLRAFQLTECLRNNITLEMAVTLGSPWEDVKVALELYAKRWNVERKKEFREQEEKIFSQIF